MQESFQKLTIQEVSQRLNISKHTLRLKRKGMSLLGIKRKLNSIHGDHADETEPKEVDMLANQIAEIVRRAVYRYFEEGKSV
jgi:DNA-binding transcriptional MerR regulator